MMFISKTEGELKKALLKKHEYMAPKKVYYNKQSLIIVIVNGKKLFCYYVIMHCQHCAINISGQTDYDE